MATQAMVLETRRTALIWRADKLIYKAPCGW